MRVMALPKIENQFFKLNETVANHIGGFFRSFLVAPRCVLLSTRLR